MKKLLDVSDHYDASRALDEQVNWLLTGYWKKHLDFLENHANVHGQSGPIFNVGGNLSILEIGCGSGILAAALPDDVSYLGVDRNPHFLEMARQRNKDAITQRRHEYLCWDVRNLDRPPRDLVMAWSFMKHFGLYEWEQILAKVLSFGQYGAFSMQIADRDHDDGVDYHHVCVRQERVYAAVKAAGHEVLQQELLSSWSVGDHLVTDQAFWTRATAKVKVNDTAVQASAPPTYEVVTHDVVVDGRKIADLHTITLRWVALEDGRSEPTLYENGKRVVKPWRIDLRFSAPADPSGENANTGES